MKRERDIDIEIDVGDLPDLSNIEAELDRVLEAARPGIEAWEQKLLSLPVDSRPMKVRHREGARVLKAAAMAYFGKKGKTPRCA